MTLEDFLARNQTISIHENIFLINNPLFYNRYHSCIKETGSKKDGIGGRIKKNILEVFHIEIAPYYELPKRSAIIFLGHLHKSFDSINQIDKLYNKIKKNHDQSYILLIGKGDYEFDERFAKNIPKNLKRIFANNVNVKNQNVSYFPMGRDFRNAHLFDKFSPILKKPILCYCNFSLNTHPLRQILFDSIKTREFIKFAHMGNFLSYSITREKFFEDLQFSKFVICPRGNGLDTFRMWDCLYLGTIPIVVKEAIFQKELEDLPILFINKYEDYSKLTKEYLEHKYLEMLSKKYNFKKLLLSYWFDQVEKTNDNR